MLSQFTATGTLLRWDGTAAAGAYLYLGAQVSVRPLLAGDSGADDPSAYPPFAPPPGVTEPTPIPLFTSPPSLLDTLGVGGAVPMRSVVTGAGGTFSCVLPTPAALAWAAGARTDVDLDPTRGGVYSVVYAAILPDGRLITFAVDVTAIQNGSLDISTLLSAPPF